MSAEAAIDSHDYRIPESYERFLEDLRSAARITGKPIISPKLFCSALNMDIQSLATKAHVHRVTITRAQGAEKLQGYLRDAMRVLGAATDINGAFKDAVFWFRNEPISTFDYRTPEQLVSEGRTEDLLSYIQSLKAGATG